MRRWLAVLAALFAVGCVALAGVLFMVREALAPADPNGAEVVFTVSPGQSVAAVAAALQREGLVRDARAVRGLARWHGLENKVQVGEFAVSAAMTPEEILRKIVSGQVVTYPLVLPEGLRLEEIADRVAETGLVDRDAFLAVARDPASATAFGVEGDTLEGYLFPETYRLPRGIGARELARVMVDQFLGVWAEIRERAAAAGFSMKEVVTLGSIIEKETGAANERPLIASVFLNRLERGMRLETDPTVIYGIENFDGNIRRRHLEDASNPYNTYKIKGLPPGPIASPGRAALVAVVEPAESDYLFFVSRNDGTHVFSKTYREHEKAVDEYQRRGRRRR
ncbi:MAG: endolytic transglycosylase MltG [Myxococcota bacterium]|nr:endolytic transglycosylase MltG [Myxococcota bacterium]